MTWKILQGDALTRLRDLPDRHFHCCVTSPPYYGLRDYGTGVWEGGDANCDHRSPTMREGRNEDRPMLAGSAATNTPQLLLAARSACGKCGAIRVDQQVGLEKTPTEFVARLVEIFAEVHRVLRDDGTFWLNIGDTWNHDAKWGGSSSNKNELKQGYARKNSRERESGCKPKDMIGIPWMLAFALRSWGWYLRSEIIWAKTNCMSESVEDRPTKSHEQLFLLTKRPRYYYDGVAIREPSAAPGKSGSHKPRHGVDTKGGNQGRNGVLAWDGESRNKRSVWRIGVAGFKGAHFAVFPPKLVEPCILAGTSAKGCCPQCGAQWARLVEKTRKATRPAHHTKVARASSSEDSPYNGHGGLAVGNRDPKRHITIVKTIGWEPGCKCGLEAASARVLDPFSGAGTTVMVASRLGRNGTGIELNQEYAEMSRARIVGDSPLFNTEA